MQNERCTDHDWFCKRKSGLIGEIVKGVRLTEDEVQLVKDDPIKTDEVCPGGIIMCNKCDILLIKGQSLPGLTTEFVQDLEGKIQ